MISSVQNFSKPVVLTVMTTAVFYILKELLADHLNHHNGLQDSSKILSIRGSYQLLSHILNNYLSFMGTIITLRLIIALIHLVLLKSPKQIAIEDNPFNKVKQGMLHFCKRIICYSMVFICFQIASSLIHDPNETSSLSLVSINSQIPQYFNKRQLSEIESSPREESEKLILSPFLNPGEILGSFALEKLRNLDDIDLIVSKDGKTLFVMAYMKLLVYDISNPRNAQQIASLSNVGSDRNSLLFSPNGQILYITTEACLDVVDISNRSSPTNIATKCFGSLGATTYFSMTMSSDGKTLYYVNHRSIIIYDISEPASPRKIYDEKSDFGGSIAISRNDGIIVVGFEDKFEIWNVVDPKLPTVISSIPTDGLVYKIYFSNDERKLFLGVHSGFKDEKSTILDFSLRIFDITDIKLPKLLTSTQLVLTPKTHDALKGTLWLHSNEEYVLFHTRHEFKMMRIFDKEQTSLFSEGTSFRSLPFTATPENKINIVYFYGVVRIMKFHIDIVPKSLIHFKPNALKVIDEIDYERMMAIGLSPDENSIFLGSVKSDRKTAMIIPYETKTGRSFEKLNPSSDIDASNLKLVYDEHFWDIIAGQNAVAVSSALALNARGYISMLNTTNKNNSWVFGNILSSSYDDEFNYLSGFLAIAFTHDDKTLINVHDTDNPDIPATLNLVTWNQQNASIEMPARWCDELSTMKISSDDNFVFFANCDLMIFDIRDRSEPTLELVYDLNVSKVYGLAVSKDQKILYLFGQVFDGSKILQIFNISNVKTPRILSSTLFEQNLECMESVELRYDEKLLFVGLLDGVLMIDIQIPTQPVVFGKNYFREKIDPIRFATKRNTFYTASFEGVTGFDLSSQYLLHIQNPEFKIGKPYSIPVNVLQLNRNLKFDYMMKKHKFFKVTLFDKTSISDAESSTALPTWITFDQERSLLHIEPNSPSANGTYIISVTLSTQTEPSAFIGLNSISNLSEAKELMLNLLHGGYVDNQGYVSGDFDINKELLMPSKYQNMDRDIRAILSKNYIQAMCEITVSSSLSLIETKPLKISSLSKGTVYVTIQLDREKGNPLFLTRGFSSLKPNINNEKSLLHLEGLLENVNEALKEIVIDLNKLVSCNGVIHATDGINPPLTHEISSISNYLRVNGKPLEDNLALSLQEQIDNQPCYTGLYFISEINSTTFQDKNGLALEYSLEMEDPKQGLPSWIALRGLNLMGTAPESVSKLSHKFILVVKNEFQEIRVPFILNVKISFYYAIKLVGTLVGYIVSLVGLVYSVNKVYNILARKYYRHPRSFKLKVGEEITDNSIFPISFIQNEMIKAKEILKSLEENIESPVIRYFIDPQSQTLDKEKIISSLESLNHKEYNEANKLSRQKIQQIVINMIVIKQLATKQAKFTKSVFDKIKNNWMDLVTVSASQQFIINSKNLEQELSSSLLGLGENLDETHLESSELLKDKFDLDLLANAILAHAFEYQNLDIDLIFIDVVSHKRIKGRSLWHLLKKIALKNLKPFAFLNKREIGCGIEYKITNNTLHFFGKLTSELENDTIVVHLKNYRGRILRELSIIGFGGEDSEEIQSKIHNSSQYETL